MIKLVNIILRLRILISIFKSFIISKYSRELPIIKHSEITITVDDNKDIVED